MGGEFVVAAKLTSTDCTLTVRPTMQTNSRCVWFALSTMIFATCGCRTPNLGEDESTASRQAYETYTKESKHLGISPQPYENWKLFRDQTRLKQRYLDLLRLDTDKLMEQSMKAAAVYAQELDKLLASQGITNRVASGHGPTETVADDPQVTNRRRIAEEGFRKTHGHILCDGNTPIAAVWECWANFAEAESCFTAKMSGANVSPADALSVLTLSNRHRRSIGQWECRETNPQFFTSPPHSESPLLDPVDARRLIAKKRRDARQLLGGIQVDAKSNPHTAKLVSLAREELRNSERSEPRQHFSIAYQWAADALVTAQSARQLHALETRSPR
jgi:hypothetical protein